MNNSLSFAVLVLSCDKYSDLWPAFFFQFKKHFPDLGCVPVYLGSNTEVCDEPGVVSILSGPDSDWSSSLKAILQQIPEDNLFVILEDLFPCTDIDPGCLEEVIEFMGAGDVCHVKYWNNPQAHIPVNAMVSRYPAGMPYLASVCGFWRRQTLEDLLVCGETAWDFEINGSYRASFLGGFFGLNTPLFGFKNLVEKGRWIAASVAWASAEGLPLTLEKRPAEDPKRTLVSVLKSAYFDLMIRVPWRVRVRAMNALRKLLVSY